MAPIIVDRSSWSRCRRLTSLEPPSCPRSTAGAKPSRAAREVTIATAAVRRGEVGVWPVAVVHGLLLVPSMTPSTVIVRGRAHLLAYRSRR
jgi:hypothetical protein